MADETFSAGPFGNVERKVPLLGRVVAGAIDAMTTQQNPYVYFLLVLDPDSGAYTWASNGEKEGMRAALQDFLTKHAH